MIAILALLSISAPFVTINGKDLIQPDGTKLLIRGTNLGNWLNPEGYMFNFDRCTSPNFIERMVREISGPDFADDFWKKWKDNYITRDDIQYIKKTGANTVRLPFNYRLFTYEDYLGETNKPDGFNRIDTLINWCREADLYLILDMHDAPGGQTGDNIDDSYGYYWLWDSDASAQKFLDIWTQIAERYKNEPVILGYELLNEPIAPYWDWNDEVVQRLQPLYKRAVAAIRTQDTNHIVLLGGARWNSDFYMFDD